MRTMLRQPGRRLRSAPVALFVAGASALALLLVLGMAPAPKVSSQSADGLFFPDLQAELRSTGSGVVLFGQESLGTTGIDVQNLGTAEADVLLSLFPKSGVDPARLRTSLPAGGSGRMSLADYGSVTGGFYSGQLSANQPLAAWARLRWPSGATVAYEGGRAATQFILPLVARTVYSNTTILYTQNADPGPGDNSITLQLFDRDDGGMISETTCTAEPGETCYWDTAHANMVFGPEIVGTNAPTDGWLGHLWFRAARPIAVLAYGDEMEAQGSCAYLGRPIASAATLQYLPLVRRNWGGGSLIAIANASQKTAQVRIDYLAAAIGALPPGTVFVDQFSIAPRGAVFLDLADRGRGSVEARQPPAGDAPETGFIGSAVIESSQPILAAVQDEQLANGRVDSISAYNAFGPDDLGGEWRITALRKMIDYQSTVLWAQNPSAEPLAIRVEVFDERNARMGELSAVVPPGGLERLPVAELEALPAGIGTAIVRGSGPFAALVGDERDERGTPSIGMTVAYLRAMGESRVGGIARFIEKGSDVQVNLEIRGTWPGARYTAAIVSGACGSKQTSAWSLNDPGADGKSTTLLRQLSIDKLTEKPYAVVIQSSGWPGRQPRDVACGNIETPPGAEIIDTTLVWPLRVSKGGVIAAPTSPPPTASPSPPPTLPPPTVTAAPTSAPPEHAVYLPRADR